MKINMEKLKNAISIYAIELGKNDIEFMDNLKNAINQGVQEGFKKTDNKILDDTVILTRRAFSRTLRNINQHIDVYVDIILKGGYFPNLDYNIRLCTNYGDYILDDYKYTDDMIEKLLEIFKKYNISSNYAQKLQYKLFIMQAINDAEQLGEGTCASICNTVYKAIGTDSGCIVLKDKEGKLKIGGLFK
jgi:hypothetical protein